MLSRCCNLTTLPLPFPLSFASLDTHGYGIAESSWLTDTTTPDAGSAEHDAGAGSSTSLGARWREWPFACDVFDDQ